MDVLLRDIPATTVLYSKEVYALPKQGNLNYEIKPNRCSAFLVSVTQAFAKKSSKETALKLVLPVEDGYVVRSDFLQWRLYGCSNVSWKEEFIASREHRSKSSLSSNVLKEISEILIPAAGAVVVDDVSGRSQESLLSELETEFFNRLSLPWLIAQPIPQRKTAILGHHTLFMMERWFTAGQTMGIRIFVFGQHGSWLEHPRYSHLIEQFIPIDMSVDQDLTSRILGALQNLVTPSTGSPLLLMCISMPQPEIRKP